MNRHNNSSRRVIFLSPTVNNHMSQLFCFLSGVKILHPVIA